MVSLIAGKRGSGKTKKLLELANEVIERTNGNVVFIERNNNLGVNVDNRIRLIDVADYGINNFDTFYGFICGICSADYDIKDIFIDTIITVGRSNLHEFEVFANMLKDMSKKHGVNLTLSVSIELEYVPSFISGNIKDI